MSRNQPHTKVHRPTGHDPAYFQERHSPTEPVLVKISNDRTAEVTRRRVVDARLINSLTIEQERSAISIEQAHELIASETNCRTSQLGVWIASGRHGEIECDRNIRLQREYKAWVKLCQAEGINFNAALDILVECIPVSHVDLKYGRKSGWARGQLIKALDAFASLKGWTREVMH